MTRTLVASIAVALIASAAAADSKISFAHLDQQLANVRSDTALIFSSEAIDEYPLWSSDSRYLAVNVDGEWQKVDLTLATLSPATWRGDQRIGVIANRAAVSRASQSDISAWRKRNALNSRKANVGGTVVELQANELSTALVVTSPGRKPQTRWESAEENCHSLVVAPDKTHVAFICEMNGVLILRVGP